MPGISRRLVSNAIAARLGGVTNALGFLGNAGRGLDGTLGQEPQPKSPTDARVQPYFVLFPGVGGPNRETDVADSLIDLDITLQINVAGGDIEDVLALADRIHDRLHRWSPGLVGTPPDQFIVGRLHTPPGFNPGPPFPSPSDPPRFTTPLQYQLTAHT